jgi:hypothetical protein
VRWRRQLGRTVAAQPRLRDAHGVEAGSARCQAHIGVAEAVIEHALTLGVALHDRARRAHSV